MTIGTKNPWSLRQIASEYCPKSHQRVGKKTTAVPPTSAHTRRAGPAISKSGVGSSGGSDRRRRRTRRNQKTAPATRTPPAMDTFGRAEPVSGLAAKTAPRRMDQRMSSLFGVEQALRLYHAQHD